MQLILFFSLSAVYGPHSTHAHAEQQKERISYVSFFFLRKDVHFIVEMIQQL